MKYLRGIFFALLLALVSSSVWAVSVNINEADADTLATQLVGVGTAKAAAIVAYREANGPFKNVDELSRVKGIGAKLVEKNRANLIIEQKTQ